MRIGDPLVLTSRFHRDFICGCAHSIPSRDTGNAPHSTLAPAPDRPAAAKPPVPHWAWTRLAACTGAAALLQLDGTLITVALPTVAHGLDVSRASTSVVLSAYFAAYAAMLMPGGELVDRFGARRLALVDLGLFAAGAVAGALCPTFDALAVTRMIQGAGAGLVSPAALAGAVSGFAAERRGTRSACGAQAPECRTCPGRC